MILLDTNVLSELMRPAPAPAVVRWLSAQPTARVFTSAITEAELLYGVALLPAGRRRSTLEDAVRTMLREEFAARILPFDGEAAAAFAAIAAERRQAGRPIAQADAQIAGIARSRGAVLATRNMVDFEGCGVIRVDPWQPG